MNRVSFAAAIVFLLLPSFLFAQSFTKTWFNPSDSTSGYYVHVAPKSGEIKGVLFFLTGFAKAEDIFQETQLQNVAYSNGLLTVGISIDRALAADSAVVDRLNRALGDVVKRFSVKSEKFVMGGFGSGGTIALRYVELCNEHPGSFPVQPKGVFAISPSVDMVNQVRSFEREIKYNKSFAGEAKFFVDLFTKNYGAIDTKLSRYEYLSPFSVSKENGNEQFLKNVGVRVYFDMDVTWYIEQRQRSLYDTGIPDASEFITRLRMAGSHDAAFITAKSPGVRSNGVRNPNAWSVVDASECIQWAKQKLGILDRNNFKPSYSLATPPHWTTEQIFFPIDFAPNLGFNGVEDLRFPPGFDDVKSAEYWSYGFVWAIGGSPKFDARILEEKIKMYYQGFVDINLSERGIDPKKAILTTCVLKKLDESNYAGTVKMFDYKTEKPIALNVKINVKAFPGKEQKTYVLATVSPQAPAHAVWQKLNALVVLFDAQGE